MNIQIIEGDCFQLINELEDDSVDLVITSPPYSDIINYGKKVSTKKPADYVDWLLPLFSEIERVLKPSGSFILNINDKAEKGYKSTYIYELIYRNSTETNLKLYDTYIWWKKNGIPNGATKRFRNTTEFIFHFCKDNKEMKFYMDRVLEEPKESSNERYKYDMTNAQGEVKDGVRIKKKVVTYPGKIVDGVRGERIKKEVKIRKTNMVTDANGSQNNEFVVREVPDLVRPDNVFRFPTAAASRDNLIKHPAPYHKELPLYFINLLTDKGDLIVDPFSGIGTTGLACKELERNYIGFELNDKYVDFSRSRLNDGFNESVVYKQYDKDDNFIRSFETRKELADWIENEVGIISFPRIRDIVSGKEVVCGYKWKIE